jgi:hypothetical protein
LVKYSLRLEYTILPAEWVNIHPPASSWVKYKTLVRGEVLDGTGLTTSFTLNFVMIIRNYFRFFLGFILDFLGFGF